MVSARTDRSELWTNADGTQTTRFFARPKYFQRDGNWVPIDTTVVGDASSGFESTGNAWSARFTRDGVSVRLAKGTVAFAPLNFSSGLPSPERGAGGSTVRYPQVWPGVDVEYTVEPDGVSERLVLTRPQGLSSFSFSLDGAGVAADPDGGMRLSGPLAGEARFAPPLVVDRAGEPVPQARAALGDASSALVGNRVALSVDPVWLAAQPASAYPLVLDPDLHVGPDAITSYANGNYSWSTGRVGNSRAGGDRYWRTVAHFPYWPTLQDKKVVSASVAVTPTGGASGSFIVAAHEATAWAWSGAGDWLASGSLGSTTASVGGPNLVDRIQSWVNDQWNGGTLMMVGQESPGLYTYKTVNLQLDVTYSTPPTAPGQVGPASGVTVPTATPTLVVNPSTDPDPGDWVNYRFEVGPPGGSPVWTSPVTSARQVPVPPDQLKDGQTYAWRAVAVDTFGAETASPWWNMRVDRRLAGSPAPVDELGPVTVNLGTGDAGVAVATPTTGTLGGAAGATLSYHSSHAASDGQAGTAIVPKGWTLGGGDADGWVRAVVNPQSVVLQGADGDTAEYTMVNGRYSPPPGTHGVLTKAGDGSVTPGGRGRHHV